MELAASLDFEGVENALNASHEVCGKGDKGTAYYVDDQTVLKLHPKYDEPYIKFIRWVCTLKYTEYSKYFPNVQSVVERPDCILITMEKLTPFNSLTGENVRQVIPLFSPTATDIHAAFSHFVNRMIHKVDLKVGRAYIRPKYKAFSTGEGLETAISALLDNVYVPGFATDLHVGNVMFRVLNCGEIVPVIIDPFN